jgi:predicted outer membrane lipoprotein
MMIKHHGTMSPDNATEQERYIRSLLHKGMVWFRMERNYWIVFIILIAIMCYAIISFQWLLGVIACIVVVIIALVLSHLQDWGKTSK